ncbi:uncharacterized protein LY89DRAFT_744475 [Mollisia scopiformis]|uniref:Uncharacterized protein n=1 Tax=Mollisia scopiformis TaxID=149040 RepID=A0A194XUP2_MOLSC|nr:uncharacterized protein LY89DRAFT_744475 [Mollisia scopiformis]KUJ23928.1 hypothetical protein LY89DRAFT_744475 [Mollisia scopiformis]
MQLNKRQQHPPHRRTMFATRLERLWNDCHVDVAEMFSSNQGDVQRVVTIMMVQVICGLFNSLATALFAVSMYKYSFFSLPYLIQLFLFLLHALYFFGTAETTGWEFLKANSDVAANQNKTVLKLALYCLNCLIARSYLLGAFPLSISGGIMACYWITDLALVWMVVPGTCCAGVPRHFLVYDKKKQSGQLVRNDAHPGKDLKLDVRLQNGEAKKGRLRITNEDIHEMREQGGFTVLRAITPIEYRQNS